MPIISRTFAITRWSGVALVCCATLGVAGRAGAQGLRSTTSQVSLIVVKKETDERVTRDFAGSAPTVATQPSLVAIGVMNLPAGVRAFVRAANGRLIQLESTPVPVNSGVELFVRLQGPASALNRLEKVQLNAASEAGILQVVQLSSTTRASTER